jgi:hypothetical protein
MWQNRNAKKLPPKDILDGKVVVSMMPKEVLAMRPEYLPYRKNFFNLRNLQKTIRENQAKADSDCAALAAFFHRQPTVPKATHDGMDLVPKDT